MKFHSEGPDGVFTIELERIGDSRGFFSRFWCQRELAEHGLEFDIAQINNSYNPAAGTTRGLHYQQEPHAEAKIVSCTSGRVFDVAVDIRPNSATYLQWFGTVLTPENDRLLYVPAGFAHGYQTLEDKTRLLYLASEFYAPDAECGIRYDDPAIGIEWPMDATSVSEKDSGWPLIGN